MTFVLGDRVRWTTTGDDGLPLVRYGFVGGVASATGPALVMLDGELNGKVIDLAQLEPVSMTTVELHLDGFDLLDDPELRRGLVHLWQAEAESAGLDVDSMRCMGSGEPDDTGAWWLAELTSGGAQYAVRAARSAHEPGVVCVRADRTDPDR